MPISAELLAQITAGSDISSAGGGALGQRSEARLPAGIHLAMILIKGVAAGKAMRVRVRDVSNSGVGIEAAESMRVNDEFAVRFERAPQPPVWVHYAVVRWQPIANNKFVIGGRFVAIINLKTDGGAAAAA
jgi:hypothetical protein